MSEMRGSMVKVKETAEERIRKLEKERAELEIRENMGRERI